jgi:hypothetical protein
MGCHLDSKVASTVRHLHPLLQIRDGRRERRTFDLRAIGRPNSGGKAQVQKERLQPVGGRLELLAERRRVRAPLCDLKGELDDGQDSAKVVGKRATNDRMETKRFLESSRDGQGASESLVLVRSPDHEASGHRVRAVLQRRGMVRSHYVDDEPRVRLGRHSISLAHDQARGITRRGSDGDTIAGHAAHPINRRLISQNVDAHVTTVAGHHGGPKGGSSARHREAVAEIQL